MRWIYVCVFLCLQRSVQVAEFKWTPEYKLQAGKTTCIPGDYRNNASFQHNTNQRSAIFTHLGKVQDIEVCGLLCCEVESCDLALLEKNDHCYAVKCNDVSSCDLNKFSLGDSQIVTFRRKSGSDVWSSGDSSSRNRAPDHKEEPRILTKEAAIEKSSVSKSVTISNSEQENSAAITMSNNLHPESPMDALLQKETLMIHDKQQKQDEENKLSELAKKAQVTDKIQDFTEHYLKVEEKKSDITSLQENETSSVHPKVAHRRRDLRHTLISPITIGAFTCMAVIAVSGFAMAIIKYQRERKEYEDKQTQKP